MTLQEWMIKHYESGLLSVIAANAIQQNFKDQLDKPFEEWAKTLKFHHLTKLRGVGLRTAKNIVSVMDITGHRVPNYHYGDEND